MVAASSFYERDAPALARALIGCRLLLAGVGGVIVETEAYTREDPASHSARGRTVSNAAMFGSPGDLYVYRSYGLHWCLNIVAQEPGSAVLIRALQPTHGLDVMRRRRAIDDPRLLCAGPGRLCRALAVTGAYNGASVSQPPFELAPGEAASVLSGVRIGVSKAVERPWRFALAGSPFVSRPLRS